MKTKLFTLLLAVAASIGTMLAWDYERVQIGNLYYNLDSKNLKAEVTSKHNELNGYSSSLTITSASIPSTVSYSGKTYKVTTIGNHAFRGCTSLTSITIPNSITLIDNNAFRGCSGLTSIKIPSSVTSIGGGAFESCSGLTSVTIGNSVTSIGQSAFEGCSGLTSVTIPNSVTSIEEAAFRNCTSLTSVTIPNSVTSIVDGAFEGCTSLPIENNIRYAGRYLVEAVNKTLSSYTIKSGTKWIGSSAFRDCSNLNSITIPSSVKEIQSYAFSDCTGLTSVTIPDSVTSIGHRAFSGCTGLTGELVIPNSVTSIGDHAFSGCTGLTSITIPENITGIAPGAFSLVNNIVYTGSVTSFDFGYYSSYSPWGAKSINGFVDGYIVYRDATKTELLGCSSAVNGEVVIPTSVTSIGEDAFSGCTGLTGELVIPNSVTSIGEDAFWGCSGLTSVTIGNSVTSIGDNAFRYCSNITIVVWNAKNGPSYNFGSQVTSFTFGNEVETIQAELCKGMTNLTSITIPNSVTSIGNNAFLGCTGLTSVVWNAKNCSSSGNFGSQVTSFTFGNDVEIIPASICAGMSNLTSIIIPNSVTSIGNDAFSGCSSLTSVTILNSVTSIGNDAFSGCSSLTSVTIPNSVTSIGDNAFRSCSSLTSVTIGNSVTSIGDDAFWNCSSLTSVTIGNSVTSIGSSAFEGCSNITIVVWNAKNGPSYNFGSQVTSFTFGNEVEIIPAELCKGMTNLTSVTIPNSVNNIGNSAFNGCSIGTINFTGSIENWCNKKWSPASISNNLKYKLKINGVLQENVVIPNSVTSIDNNAFYGCSSLTSMTIPNSVNNIGNSAFQGCSSLTSVTVNSNSVIRNNLKNIFGSQVTQYIIGSDITSIPNTISIGYSDLTSIVVESGNSTYDSRNDCNAIIETATNSLISGCKNTVIPDNVTRIDNNAFYGCSSLTSIEIPNSVTSIGERAFYECSSLTSIEIPNSVTSIGDRAFYECSGLTSVTIGNSITSIGDEAFSWCSSLISVTIGNSITSIGDEAFSWCSSLTSVTCLATTPPVMGYEVFNEVYCSNIPLYVPIESVSLYQAANIWKEFNVIGVMFADEVETAVFSASPTDDYGVILEWQAVENAVLYNIDIIQGNDTIRKLQFDSNGKLLNSPSNAPSRYPNIHHASTAILSGNGWRCEVNDLDPRTNYTYSITVKAENGSVLYTQSIGFTTKEETFIIKFVNWNGEELLVLPEVVKGTTPCYTGETPVRPNTAEYTYTFVGWTPAIVAATSDTTYTATYTATKNSYTITWQNEDGSQIDLTTVEYGVVPTHAEPTKQATAEYTYTFTGWTPAVVAVTGDATYKATFSSVVNVYTISVSASNGQVIGGGEYQYGATIDLTAIPNEGYVFDQWSDGVKDNPRTITVTGAAEYTALFTSTEGFENIYTSESVQKVIIDQKVYILRGDKTYTVTGVEVK